MSAELEHIWSRVQEELALAVDEPTYRIWLAPLRPVQLAGEQLVVEAPPHTCDWIHDRFGRVIQASVELILGPHAAVEIAAAVPDVTRPPARAVRPYSRQPASPRQSRGGPHEGGELRGALDLHPPGGALGNPKLTFDQFVIGDSNRLAHAAALTVAEMPAQAYNPLFICGPPGVGKTHLLTAIASLLLSHNPGLTVRCTTGEAFTNEFLGALGGRHTEGFKARFRHIDVLLMDDVQFLERKARTEEEFFHTFNALHDGGRQIVISSDRPPRDLQALEDRLRERFEAGLVADIKPPDLPTRLTILRKRAHHDGVELADEVALSVIAERIDTNVRALEGALIRVVAFSSLTGRPLTGELATEVLDGLYPATKTSRQSSARSIDEIQAAVAEHFSLSPEELLSTSRTARVAWPRQLAMYLARELTGESLPAIGRKFGGRDHTTVLHAWRRTAARIASDDDSRLAVEKLCERLGRQVP
ncbi:MAG TPA: chromosomal replication initiator protein DnaA [Solirubrobacteraceae bacterium]|nr:chromosomal replication initiator protein DnaA [Solirubrobacteraceae bacterium]